MTAFRPHAIATAVILALAAAAAVTVAVRGPADDLPEPGDRVLRAVAELREDRVHVAPDGRPMLDEEAERDLERLIAAREVPVHVVVWEPSWFAGYSSPRTAARQILTELGTPAVVVLWQGVDGSVAVTSESHVLRDARADDYQRLPEPEFLGEASLRLSEWVAALPEGLELSERSTARDEEVATDITVGLIVGGILLVVTWLLIGVLRLATGRRFRNLPYDG
ncbi:hypothetical protein [Nocardioides sp.]|uniref:hypothetical protein n=1 Tax=Nocardioides sp. TaxID=35761 RepID=UPI0027350230|nr:hypothetical protein [Nocardioides sp.]MDP3890316.1 hypothetical protein [Nocardioides sp.]